MYTENIYEYFCEDYMGNILRLIFFWFLLEKNILLFLNVCNIYIV